MAGHIDNLELSPLIIQEVFGEEFHNELVRKIHDSSLPGKIVLVKPENSPIRSATIPQADKDSGLKPPKSRRVQSPSLTSSSSENSRGLISVFDLRRFHGTNQEHPIHHRNKIPNPTQEDFDPLQNQINHYLIQATNARQLSIDEKIRESTRSRLGPNTVVFDLSSHTGSFIMHLDRLGLISQCNFGSIRANTCLFKGKWQYEVLLGSKGIMQIGWATLKTTFDQERGVGDSSDSFAFDGNRLRRWNKSPAHYGENWQTGDVIGCCINLDDKNIEYYRNGKSLGIAFTNIPLAKGIAYFPAVSLSWGEQVTGNFGGSPLRYPVPGFNPIQIEKSAEDAKLTVLLGWLEKVTNSFGLERLTTLTENEKKTLQIINLNLFQFIGSNLNSEYAIQDSFLPLLAKCIGLPEKSSLDGKERIESIPMNYDSGTTLLEYMWSYLQEDEMRKCIEKTCKILLYLYRGNVQSLNYTNQFYSLRLLATLASHRKTRRYMIHHLLFDQIKLTHFMHIKPLDDEVLKEIIPRTWWEGKSAPTSIEALQFELGINVIQEHVRKMEKAQIQLLKLLLTNTDGTEKRPSSRSILLRKFRTHIKETIKPSLIMNQPMNKAMCTFFRILKLISELWSEEIFFTEARTNLPELPVSVFYDCTIDFNDSERLGGLTNFLFKTHHVEVSADLGIADYVTPTAENNSGVETTPMPSIFGFNPLSNLVGIVPNSSLSTPSVSNAGSHPQPSRASANADQNSQVHAATSSPVQNLIPLENEDPLAQLQQLPITIEELLNGPPETPSGLAGTTESRNSPGVLLGVLHPPSAITSFSHTENIPDLRARNPSNTSSAEDINTTSASTNTGNDRRQLINNRALGIITNSLIGSAGGLMITPMFENENPFRLFRGGPFFGFMNFDRAGVRPVNPIVETLGRNNGAMDSTTSLRELLDDAILIFSCGIKRHVEKVVTYRKMANNYSQAIMKFQERRRTTNPTPEQEAEIQKSIDIFTTKLDELSRNLAWIKSAVFTVERQHYVYELLKSVLTTLKAASTKGLLFTFVPEYYVTTLLHLTHFLIHHIHPTLSYQDLPGIRDTLIEVAEFVASHFADPRIILADTKDSLTSSLFGFICEPEMLLAMENMPQESRTQMIKFLLRPYENRAWAQNNLMLVRLWQGSGFAFRYPASSLDRRSFRVRNFTNSDHEIDISTLPPNPSTVFQNHISQGSRKLSSQYIHSVLNQLNWSFSEFVGLLQEIHSNANRSDRVYMESRQIRICCTCYELTQQLLRVLEMIVNLAPTALTQASHGNGTNESLLTRLCMLVSQVLNRIGTYTGTFAQVMDLNISGLESVSYYSILSSIAGILVALIRPELNVTDQAQLLATKTLLREPSFLLSSLDFLLGRNIAVEQNQDLAFSLEQYVPDDVSESEIADLKATLGHLGYWATRLDADNESISDDEICTICYAYPKSTTLKPCNHRSCRPCILHHLMNRAECFFCKGTIQQVIADDGTVVIDRTKTPPDSESSSSTLLD